MVLWNVECHNFEEQWVQCWYCGYSWGANQQRHCGMYGWHIFRQHDYLISKGSIDIRFNCRRILKLPFFIYKTVSLFTILHPPYNNKSVESKTHLHLAKVNTLWDWTRIGSLIRFLRDTWLPSPGGQLQVSICQTHEISLYKRISFTLSYLLPTFAFKV